jgi:hypothetical protein
MVILAPKLTWEYAYLMRRRRLSFVMVSGGTSVRNDVRQVACDVDVTSADVERIRIDGIAVGIFDLRRVLIGVVSV